MAHRVHQNNQYWIGYCRCTTEKQAKSSSSSIEAQSKSCRDYYSRLSEEERRGRPYKMFAECGVRNSQALLALINTGKVYGIIAVNPSRVTRELETAGQFFNGNIQLRFTSITNNAAAFIEYAMHVFERNTRAQMIKRALRTRAQKSN